MWEIILILIIALLAVLMGIIIYANKNSKNNLQESTSSLDEECCGDHEMCEKDTLLSVDDKIIYYNDEQLDKYTAVEPDDYSSNVSESFREVLYAMDDNDVAGWLRSLQLRNIEPPYDVREEALMIVSELRGVLHG